MKYLEELMPGDIFSHNNEIYLLSMDHRKDKDKKKHSMCISLSTGMTRWLADNSVADIVDLYRIDSNNNFAPIKSNNKNVSDQ